MDQAMDQIHKKYAKYPTVYHQLALAYPIKSIRIFVIEDNFETCPLTIQIDHMIDSRIPMQIVIIPNESDLTDAYYRTP
jgi:hypothetical protein